MRLSVNILLAWLLPLLFGVQLLLGATTVTATGFREMSVDGVMFGVWYPSDATPTKQRLGPFDVEIARDAPILTGKHQIILFSHGNSGLYRNHYLTAQALVDAGFVVVAPQHKADYLVGGRKTAAALDHRYLELSKALTAVLDAPAFAGMIDQEQVHGLGYSLGGATILLATGAGFDTERIHQHCKENRASDPEFCSGSGMVYRLNQSFRHDVALRETSDPFRNPPLITGQVVLVAPAYHGVDPSPPLSMSKLTVIAIEGDTIAIPAFHARPLFEAISKGVASKYQSFEGHHYAFIGPFPKWLTDQEDLPVVKDPEGFDRAKFIRALNTSIVVAFTKDVPIR